MHATIRVMAPARPIMTLCSAGDSTHRHAQPDTQPHTHTRERSSDEQPSPQRSVQVTEISRNALKQATTAAASPLCSLSASSKWSHTPASTIAVATSGAAHNTDTLSRQPAWERSSKRQQGVHFFANALNRRAQLACVAAFAQPSTTRSHSVAISARTGAVTALPWHNNAQVGLSRRVGPQEPLARRTSAV